MPHRVEEPAEAAHIARAHWELGGAGIVLAQPPPESVDVQNLIESAVSAAAAASVSGQAVTPFVLSYMHDTPAAARARSTGS